MIRAFRSKEEAHEVGREFREKHKEEKKEYDKLYREHNKDKKRETDRLYREKNQERIKEQKGQRFICVCGSPYTQCHKREHERTKKHQEYLNNQATEEYTEEFLQSSQDD